MDGRSSLLAVASSCRTSSMPVEPRWRLSLVLPAYNEEAGILQAVLEACEALAELTRDYEVMVVDDGSCDATAEIVAELAADRPQVRLLRHGVNRGYGAALRTGFAAARFERVAFTDADCQFHLADLRRLLPLSDRYPLVVGWREDRQDSWRRRFLARLQSGHFRSARHARSRLRLRLEGVSARGIARSVAGDEYVFCQRRDVDEGAAAGHGGGGSRRASSSATARCKQGLAERGAAHRGDTPAVLVVARAVSILASGERQPTVENSKTGG